MNSCSVKLFVSQVCIIAHFNFLVSRIKLKRERERKQAGQLRYFPPELAEFGLLPWLRVPGSGCHRVMNSLSSVAAGHVGFTQSVPVCLCPLTATCQFVMHTP